MLKIEDIESAQRENKIRSSYLTKKREEIDRQQIFHQQHWKLEANGAVSSNILQIFYPGFHSKPNCQGSSQNKDIFWHVSFQKVYLLCTLTEKAPWGSSPAKWGWEPGKKKQNLENDEPCPGSITSEWHLSSSMSHSRERVLSSRPISDESAQSLGL